MNLEQIMIFIPAYNCAKQIERVLAIFTEEVASRFCEIVVVENRSTDNTIESAKTALGKIKGCSVTLLQNAENYSLGGSHKVAFNYFLDNGYDYLVVLHGDDQGNINDMIRQIDMGKHRNCDSLLGSRFMNGSKLIGYSKFRTFGNIVFNAILSVATLSKISDMGAGLNLYSKKFLETRFYMGFPNDLTFNIYMLFYSLKKKSPIIFFPLSWREDDQVSNAKMFKQAWHILSMTFKYVFCGNAIIEGKIPTLDYSSTVLYKTNLSV